MASQYPQDEDQCGIGNKHGRVGVHGKDGVPAPGVEAACMDVVTLPGVQKAWEVLKLQVVWVAKSCKMTLDVTPSVAHPCKLQYAFNSEHAQKLHISELEEMDHFKKVNCSSDHVEIILKDDSFANREQDEVTKYVIEKVQGIISSVFCKEIPVKLAKQAKLFEKWMQKVPVQVQHQAVMVFYSSSSGNFIFVGETEANVSKVLTALGLDLEQLDEVEHVIDPHTWNVIDELGIQQFLTQQGCNVCIENNTLKGTKSEIEKSREVILLFQSRICSTEVKFKSPECADILLDADGEVNQNVEAYFDAELKKALKIPKMWYFEISKRVCVNTSKVLPYLKVYCREKEKLDTAVSVVKECLTVQTVNAKTEEVQRYMKEWTDKKKIKEISRTDTVVKVVCTRDRIKDIEDLSSFDEGEAKLAPELLEFLTQVDTNFIPEAEKKFSLTIQLNGDILWYKGRKENTKAFKKHMKQYLIRRSVPVTVSHSVLEPLKPAIEDIASRDGCCWKIKSPVSPDETMLKNCEYIATWYHPRTRGKVSVIIGDPVEVELDCLILLVNDSLYPLYDLTQCHADLIHSGADYINSIERNADYGSIVYGKPFGNRSTNVINLVVAKAHPKHPGENKNYHGLSDLFQRALVSAMKDGCKSIGLPMPMLTYFLSLGDIADAFIKSAVNIYSTEEKRTEMFLCCMKSADVGEVIAEVDKVCEGLGPGFTRRMYTEDHAFTKDTNMLKCKVKKGSLIDMKVEVLVDTTNKKLNLDQGFLSRLLRDTAGPNLQTECQQLYPEGVKYGQIAVTGAYNITQTNKHVKYIFHGALPRKTEREKYEENVYQFVWNCLIECELKKCARIAFPALGAGQLLYPHRDVAKAMFDAVEAFQTQAIEPCLKKIIFALPDNDKELHRIFSDEEKRRKKDAKIRFKIAKQRNTGYRALFTTLKIPNAPVKMTVAVDKDIGTLPSNVVEMFFTSKPGQSNAVCGIKHSSMKPETWNDQFIVTGPSNTIPYGSWDFRGAATAGVRACLKERITEMLVHTCTNIPLPIGEQIDSVVKEIHTEMKSTLPALHTVYFAVANSDELNLAIQHLAPSKSTSSWLTSLTSFISSGTQCTWHITEQGPKSAKRMILDLVGKTEDAVQKTERNIIGLLDRQMKEEEARTQIDWEYDSNPQSIGDELGAIPKGSHSIGDELGARPKGSHSAPDTDLDHVYKQSLGTSVDKDRRNPIDVVSVSADISPDVIKSKQTGLDNWLSIVETTFDLKVTKYPSCGRITVKGSLTQLLKFEKHLDETVRRSSTISDSEDKHLDKKVEGSSTISDSRDKHLDEKVEGSSTISDSRDKYLDETVRGSPAISDSGDKHIDEIGEGSPAISDRHCHEKVEESLTFSEKHFDETIKTSPTISEKHLDKTVLETSGISECWDVANDSAWNKMQGQSPPPAMVSEAKTAGNTKKTVVSKLVQPRAQKFMKDVVSNAKRKFEEVTRTESTPNMANVPKCSTRKIDLCITTSSGLNVHAVEGSIVDMEVDCIVNATNEHLSDALGVAKAIAKAAGPEFKAACKETISRKTLNAWECVETCPGNLRCQRVLHAVVPVSARGHQGVSRQLQQLVKDCLEKADGSGFQSVALPFISAGEGGHNLDVCIQQYYTAVSNFDKARMSVGDVYFVDVKKHKVDKLNKMFKTFLSQEEAASEQFRQSDREPDQGGQSIESGENETMQPVTIQGGDFDVTVEVEVGDITQTSVHAVVSIEDIEFQGNGKIASALRYHGGNDYINKLSRLKGKGKSLCCISTEGGVPLSCRNVLHTVAPSFDHQDHMHDPQSYEQDVVTTMRNILSRAAKLGCKSLAIPLLDGNWDSYKQPPPVDSCCRAMVQGIRDYCSQRGNNPPQLIKFVELDKKVVSHFYRALQMS